MAEDRVIYNGVSMHPSWPARIKEAQTIETYTINGQVFPRIRFGCEEEDWGANGGPCHDCGVLKGQYHVPAICDVERCPRCKGQVISCDCHYEGDDTA